MAKGLIRYQQSGDCHFLTFSDREEAKIAESHVPVGTWGTRFCERLFRYGPPAFGNRKTQSVTGADFQQYAASASYNPVNNQATSTNLANAVGYDQAGNITNDGVNTYAIDAESRICAYHESVLNENWTNVYDAGGHRVAKGEVPSGSSCYTGTGFVPTETDVLGQSGEQFSTLNSSGWVRTNVYANGQLLATYEGSSLYFALNDWLGTKRVVTNGTGTVQATFQSLWFGDAFHVNGSTDPSDHHYTGKLHDTQSGLDYFGARYYASSMGRFLSPDSNEDPDSVPYADFSNPQSLNLYGYVQNNPLTNTDASGNDCVTQSRTSSTSETVTVTSGGCGSGGGTYVPGTVTSITAGADGHSIDIGYNPDSGGGGVTNVSAAPSGPKMDEGAVNPLGEGQLVGIAVGGPLGKAAGAAIGGALGRIGGWLGMGAGAAAGEAAGEVTGQFALRIGGAFNRVFQTAAGPIEVDCQITVEGSTAVVKDLLIYPYDTTERALNVGTQEMRAGISGLKQELKQQGFEAMRIENTVRVTGASPGRAVNLTIKLR